MRAKDRTFVPIVRAGNCRKEPQPEEQALLLTERESTACRDAQVPLASWPIMTEVTPLANEFGGAVGRLDLALRGRP